ncbi:MAG TPA: hypothetical protein PK809_14905 [Bacteroidia bacterium]|nr:hypothetical protein [Bacteroidia bacterium]
MKTKNNTNQSKGRNVAILDEEKSVAAVAHSVFEIFTREIENSEREQKIFIDQMKALTGGRGFTISNSK